MTKQTETKWEVNAQFNANGPWKNREFDTQEEAVELAETFAGWGAWNVNWQGTRPGQENQPAWLVRDGRRL